MTADLARLERAARTSVPVDESDLAVFAMRWARRKAPAR
jgi:hypothetical protein